MTATTTSPVDRFVVLPWFVDDDDGEEGSEEEFGFDDDGSVELGSEPEVDDEPPSPPLLPLPEDLLSPVVVGLAEFVVVDPEPEPEPELGPGRVLCAAADPVRVPMELDPSGSVSLPEEEDFVAAVPVAVPVAVA